MDEADKECIEAIRLLNKVSPRLNMQARDGLWVDFDAFANRSAIEAKIMELVDRNPQVGANWLAYAKMGLGISSEDIARWQKDYVLKKAMEAQIQD